jgi:hypothetical protein
MVTRCETWEEYVSFMRDVKNMKSKSVDVNTAGIKNMETLRQPIKLPDLETITLTDSMFDSPTKGRLEILQYMFGAISGVDSSNNITINIVLYVSGNNKFDHGAADRNFWYIFSELSKMVSDRNILDKTTFVEIIFPNADGMKHNYVPTFLEILPKVSYYEQFLRVHRCRHVEFKKGFVSVDCFLNRIEQHSVIRVT